MHTGARAFASVPLCKIVATIGPVSEDAETLPKCVDAGLNVMRVNFSHATDEEVKLRLSSLSLTTGMYPLDGKSGMLRAVLLDTKGPEIRTGALRKVKETGDVKAKIQLTQGRTLRLTHDKTFAEDSDEETLFVTYPTLGETCAVGKTVLLDDGAVSLTVSEITPEGDVLCIIENDGEIASRRGVNLPGMQVNLPSMSEKDRADIKYGIEKDMDFVAASFVRKAADVEEIRAHIAQCHKECGYGPDHPPARIIAKIESTEALENLDEITKAADGIMVARGDLGVEVPLEEVVIWQKEMVERCIAAAEGKPVIVATQMLESMQKAPRPTRAEVADVTNAVLDGADAVMLSGESANGKFPVDSLKMMRSIIGKTENWMPPLVNMEQMFDETENKEDAMAASAVFTAEKINAGSIIVSGDETGDITRLVSKYRPSMPIVSILSSVKVARQLTIHRGVYPTNLPVGEAMAGALHQGIFAPSDQLVFLMCGVTGPTGIEMAVAKAP